MKHRAPIQLSLNEIELRHSIATMTSGQFEMESGVHPILKLKAWNGRLMVVFLAIALKGLPEPEDALLGKEWRLAVAAAECLACFFDRSERSGRLLSQHEADDISSALFKFLQLYRLLIKNSLVRCCHRYKVIPKVHVLVHVAEDIRDTCMNCRQYHCFLDEDFIGQMKDLTIKLPKVGLGLEYRLLTRWLLRLGASRV